MTMSSALNADRREAEAAALGAGGELDVLVIGGGVTGAGVALDAASRGLRTALVESRDLAFGTSRWSSKLVHGGLRYLASGQIGVAWESAVERGIMMTRTAPHLIRPLPQLVPLLPSLGRAQAALIAAGFVAGDALRLGARTPAALLPRMHRVGRADAVRLTPAVRADGLRGALVAHDGQLIDDARLVVALARTAAQHGAMILTRMRADHVSRREATLTDLVGGGSLTVRAKAVINATGVWADRLDESIRLRPSRGTHLVFDAVTLGNPTAALTVPVPGTIGRFVFALPQQLGRVVVGLTDEEAPGSVPDVPTATESEIDFLLDTLNTALRTALTRDDIRGAFAGLRPLLDSGDGGTADLSRRHAVLDSPLGVITVVGGKLTTYRRMAQDAVDTAVRTRDLVAGPCLTHELPLVGAPAHADSRPAPDDAPATLTARHGGLSRDVIAAATVDRPLAPIVDGIDVTRAEVEYAVTHEAALDLADIIDRRTRIGLVAADADRAAAPIAALLDGRLHRM